MKNPSEIIVNDSGGSKINIPYRQDNNAFSTSQLHFFYENFVIRCENDVNKLKYYYIRSKEIKELKKTENIDIIPFDSTGQEIINAKNDVFYFFNDKQSSIRSLLFHVRNAFVHNRIRILKNGEIELFDVVPAPHLKKKSLDEIIKKGLKRPNARITMYSKFSSFTKFKRVLLAIIKTQR